MEKQRRTIASARRSLGLWPPSLTVTTEMQNMLQNLEDIFNVSLADIREFIKAFRSEMERGLRGERSSLKMLPEYATRPTGRERGSFLALDLGGTNFRVASLELKGKRKTGPVRSDKFILQKRHIATTGGALFDFIAGCIKNFMKKYGMKGESNIGFTFSFPVKKRSISQGILVRWTKGFSARGVKGKDVVKLLNKALEKNGAAGIKTVAIINDTVSTLIARSYADSRCDIGVILGTGTNACYYEKDTAVNIEWGNFNKVKPTRYDRKLDRLSRNPGEQLLEKMVSGMYLGELAGLILADLGYPVRPEDFKTEHLSEIEGSSAKSPSRKVFKRVCSLVSKRAARLAAAAMAAVVTKIDPGLSKKHTIAIDGSLYEKHPRFAKRVRSALNEIFGKKAKNIKLKPVKNASVKGAAVVAATVIR